MADKVRRETKGGTYDMHWAYRMSVSEFEALLLSDTATQITNLEAVISAWRCCFNPRLKQILLWCYCLSQMREVMEGNEWDVGTIW